MLIAKGSKIFDGTIKEAKATIPRRVFIETSNDVSGLRGIDDVMNIERVQPGTGSGSSPNLWELQINELANSQLILKACFEKGIGLNFFELNEPTLHDVFVRLVGAGAREHTFR